MSKICYNLLLAAFSTFIRPVIVFPCKNPDSNAFSRLIAKETLYFYVEFLAAINAIVIAYYPPLVAHLKLGSSPYRLTYRD